MERVEKGERSEIGNSDARVYACGRKKWREEECKERVKRSRS